MTNSTDAADIKLLKMGHKDGHLLRSRRDESTHAYETEDGRFRVYRPESGSGWAFEDTQRWTWRFANAFESPRTGRFVVEQASMRQIPTLDAVRRHIARAYESDTGHLSEAAARAGAYAYDDETRALRRARQQAEEEAKRVPAPGPYADEQFSREIFHVLDANGNKIAGQISTASNARLFAAAPALLDALEALTPAFDTLLAHYGGTMPVSDLRHRTEAMNAAWAAIAQARGEK